MFVKAASPFGRNALRPYKEWHSDISRDVTLWRLRKPHVKRRHTMTSLLYTFQAQCVASLQDCKTLLFIAIYALRGRYFFLVREKNEGREKDIFPREKKTPHPEGVLDGVVQIISLYDYFLNSNGANSFKQRRQVRNS